MQRPNNEANTSGVCCSWLDGLCLSSSRGGKESRQPNGILGNSKQTHIKFPLKCHGERCGVWKAGRTDRGLDREGGDTGREGGGGRRGRVGGESSKEKGPENQR